LVVVYTVVAARADLTPLADRGQFAQDAGTGAGPPGTGSGPPFQPGSGPGGGQRFERAVNQETLDRVRTAGLWSLGGILVLSLGIGWVVAGRVLRPVRRITERTRDLASAQPDLSGRIALGGPDDELRRLADTIDGLLDRIAAGVEGRRRFLADAAHELRTPVTAARTTVEVAMADPDPQEQRRALATAGRQLRRMGRLVDDLLVLERGPGGRPAVLDLQALAGDAAGDLGPVAAEHGVALTVQPGARAVVEADPDDLRRAVTNLIENALVHNRRGGSAVVSVTRAGGRVLLAVDDDGPGVPEPERERVFDRLHRADRRAPGTGLGLAIARELAAAAGGAVRLEPSAMGGARFVLDLPAPG
jgi:signal transduction histidine kinase